MLNKPLKILLATEVTVMIAGSMIVPFYALFVEKIGGDILDVGLGASVFAVAAGISVLIAGRVSDRIDHKERIIGGAYLVMAAGFLLYILVDSIWLLLVTQVLIGLAEASYAPAYDALYGRHADRGGKQAATRWSIAEASYYFSAAIGAGLGAILVHFAGFTALFLTMAALCICSGAYLFTLPKNTLTGGSEAP